MSISPPKDIIATFSIVGYDPEAEEWGVAVQSKFLGVGAVVPYAKAGVGAVATQSLANTSYGPDGLALIEKGYTAEEAIRRLVENDPDRDQRQVGMVDRNGHAATYTGKNCYDWAGGMTGPGFAAQGNILVGKETVMAMGETFVKSNGSLAERLLTALAAGQRAGGDKRGRQSAALLIVKEKGGYGGYNDRALDLRVDDHPTPIKELRRIFDLHQLYFSKSKKEDIIPITNDLKLEIVEELLRVGYIKEETIPENDDQFYKELTTFYHTENFEEREQERGYIDWAVMQFLKQMSPINRG
ncbi:DUF1028 domain-containing protein [Pullulanibacillus sp. KACC 23026]|uniref:DUF1028 domain-containing protein n=1 Tax=Pullulanibacillus sp. KACC 23026 TaxID=3028315 RepID=UPI0023B034F1|nr:DUF1028 domain-containing protein [Pullulanibacillus sp. KACC 23026]WEG13121.1 DUF1028 domain-containing protein [Pullulanibacillus sp. KACC 23026]